MSNNKIAGSIGGYLFHQLDFFAGRILGFSLGLFQLLVFVLHPSWSSGIAFLTLSFAYLMLGAVVAHLSNGKVLHTVIHDMLLRYPDYEFSRVDLTKYVPPEQLSSVFIDTKILPSYIRKSIDNLNESRLYVIIARAKENTELVLGSLKAYRQYYGSKSFIFVLPSKGVLSKFMVLHEIGHLSLLSSSEISRINAVLFAQFCMLICVPWQVEWSLITFLLYSIFIILFFYYWDPKSRDIRDAKLVSEIFADLWAIQHLSLNERQTLLSLIKQGYWPDDPKFSFIENEIRKITMTTNLDAKSIVFPYIGENTGNSLMRLVVVILFALYSVPPGFSISIIGLMAGVFITIYIRFLEINNRKLQHFISTKVNDLRTYQPTDVLNY